MGSISTLFGYVLNFIYGIINNYGLSIIIFSILLKLLLLPISIKQQKTMKKTAKIQGKVKELQQKYKNDQNKMNQEIMALYKQENLSPFSGCLSSIVQIVLLIAMFGLVRSPLTYMLNIDNNTIQKIQTYIVQEEHVNISSRYPQIGILKYVSENKDKVIEISTDDNKEEISKDDNKNKINKEDKKIKTSKENEEKEKIELKDFYLNMEFLGMDLSNIPQENWNNPTVYIIPVLYVLTSILSMKLTTNMTKDNNKNKDIIIEKNLDNKEEDNKQDMTSEMNKNMTWFIPLMSVSISIIAPLGLALYWLVNNILMIVERLILNKVLKTDEEEEENG